MNWLFDSPVAIGLIGGAIAFFLGIAWVQTGRNAFLYSIAAVVVVFALLIVVERYVETDAEKVRALIYTIADDVESNDPERVARHIVSSQPELASQARNEMKNYQFTDVTIGTVHGVEERPNHQPPDVLIEFNVSVSGSFGGSQEIAGDNFQRYVKLTFWKDQDGQWRIADYEHDDPTAFIRKRTK